MKGILGWIKGHVAIVAFCAVIVISLPAAFAVSSMLNSKLRTAREKEVGEDYKALEGARITYEIPPVTPGGEPIQVPAPAPNPELTRWFREQREARAAQVEQVVSLATRINREGHKPLVEGLLPRPAESEAIFKRLEMAETIIGKEGKPSAYVALFATINAGPPVDPAKAASEISDQRTRELEKIKAERGTDRLTPEEDAELTRKLSKYRIGIYQRRANEISAYATTESLRNVLPAGEVPVEPYEVYQCYVFQWDYWVIEDLIRAFGAANSGPDGAFTPVERSVVKRIQSFSVEEPPVYGERSLAGEQWTPPAGQGSETVPLDPRVSVTGRRSSKINKLYDVRFADVTLVVDSARLLDLIGAISRTNFMTVIGCELSEVDVWKDLEDGYYYGPDHVVRAKLRIESVWLRSWTARYMPDPIQIALGAKEPGAESEGLAPDPDAPVTMPSGREEMGDLGGRRGVRDPGGG